MIDHSIPTIDMNEIFVIKSFSLKIISLNPVQ